MKSRKILALILTIAMVFGSFSMVAADTAAPEGGFADMPDNWSTAALNKAVGNGLLMGYTDGDQTLIKPDNPLTRAELAAVVNRAFASTSEADISKVTDVAGTAWYAGDMAKAVKMGTFALDTKMRPDDKITRQEAFAVLARAFKLTGTDADYKALGKFTDKADIAAWALKDLDGLAAAGYVQGSAGKLNPKANITRAEFAVVMDNLVKQYIDEAGTVTEVVAAGNVMVRVAGVTLKDVTVKGDLIIADGVGEGDVTLDSVTVEGRTVVRGGGENSIIIKGNSDLGKIIVAKVDGVVRIVVEGNAGVEIIYVDDGSDDVIVEGTIGTLEVAGDNVTVTAVNAAITNGVVSGDNSKIILSQNSTIQNESVEGNASEIVVVTPPSTGGGGSKTVAVSAISVDQQDQTLTVGATLELSVTFNPTNATNKDVTWESNDTDVATVDENGVVTAVAAGTAEITVTTDDGGFTDTVEITVEVEAVPVTGVSIDEADQTLEVGDTFQLNATVAPSDATNQNVTWSSSDEAVATVDANGLVTAVAAGTATITVTTVDGNFTATAAVTVNMTLQEQVEAAMDYQYEPAYEYNDSVTFSLNWNMFSGSYTVSEFENGQAMNDMARYLGALYRQEGSTVESITYYYPERAVYTWDEAGTLKGSNWKAADGTSLVSAIVADYNDGQSISNSLTLSNGEDTLNINFELTIEPNKEIVSVATLADINVANGTVIGDVGLPATVEVTLDDASTQTLAVTWDGGTPAYDGNTAGTYAFEGTITLAAGLANTGGYTAEVNVIVSPAPDSAIATAAIVGVTAPVNGATPVDTIAATDEYTAAIAWSPADATFGASTVYTATITLTPKAGYTVTGVAENFFTVAGATATNAADSGVVTAIFPATEAAPVVKTVTVGDLAGGAIQATVAAAGRTYAVTTANIEDGQAATVNWFDAAEGGNATAAPAGIIIAQAGAVATNALTLNVTVDATVPTVAGYYFFTVTIDGVESAVKTLEVLPADVSAPVLTATSVSDITDTTATLNFTSDEAGTYYYLVYAAADAAPSAATIKLQGDAVAKGTAAASVPAANTANVTGMTASTAYKAYVIVEDAAGNQSAVSTIEITTTPASNDVSVASVTVDSVAATVDGEDSTVYNVELPFGTDLSSLLPADVVVTATDVNAVVAAAETADSGATWTVLVTAEDTTTTETYTINVTVADPHTYTVTFEAGTSNNDLTDIIGATNYVASATATEGVAYTAPVLAAGGYVFDGWFTDAACTVVYVKSATAITSDITLYAKFTEASFEHEAANGTKTYFTSLSGAFAKGSGTVKMLKDSTVSTRNTISSGIGQPVNNIILDLGGKILTNTVADATYRAILIQKGNSLTVKNGTINFTAGDGFYLNNGRLTLDNDVDINATNHTAVVIVNGSTLTTAADIDSGNDFAIAGNGSTGYGNTTVNVNGGTITSDVIAIYQPQSGALNISDGIITGSTAVYAKSGTTTISGGTMNGNGTAAAYTYNGDGAAATGDALVIDNCGYPGGMPEVSITGGIFNSTHAKAVGSYANGDLSPITGFIIGGTFSSDPTAHVASGYAANENVGTWEVIAA